MLAKFNPEKLRAIRREKNITQEHLAEQAGLGDRYVRALERGEKCNPSASLLCQMSTVLGIPMDDLMDVSAEDVAAE